MSAGGGRLDGELFLQLLRVGNGRPLVLRLAQGHLVGCRPLAQELSWREREGGEERKEGREGGRK